MRQNFFPEAFVSMNSSWWEFTCAKILGIRREASDVHGITVVTHEWKGVIYLTDVIEPIDEKEQMRQIADRANNAWAFAAALAVLLLACVGSVALDIVRSITGS